MENCGDIKEESTVTSIIKGMGSITEASDKLESFCQKLHGDEKGMREQEKPSTSFSFANLWPRLPSFLDEEAKKIATLVHELEALLLK